MKILNLYAGIGGNRKLWTKELIHNADCSAKHQGACDCDMKEYDHDITAVEYDPEIAKAYKHFFPQDKVIVADAHQYLIDHFQEYDFIWSSPPCQSHSVTNHFLKGQGIFRYPDMKLWQEIIFLKHFCKGKYVVENVKSYYKPIIEPQVVGRHYFWANFIIPDKKIDYVQIGTMNRQASKDTQRKAIIREAQIPELTDLHGLNLMGIKLKNKRQVLRNCVYPELGKYIFDCFQGKTE